MTHKVLVPIDGSEAATEVIPQVEALMGAEDELILLRVIPEPRAAIAGLTGQEIASRAAMEEWEREAADTDLDLATQHVTRDPARLSRLVVANDDAAEQIVQTALEQGVRLIAMTTHGRGAIGRWLYGSVADRVARSSPLPVLLVRPDTSRVREVPAFRRIVIPYDGSDLAAEAFPVAAELSKHLDAPIRLVQAVYVPATPVPAVVIANISEAAEQEASSELEAAAARLEQLGVPASWEVRSGSPFFAISAATQPGDLLVLTSHGEHGVRRWMLGSVAEKLVREAPVPVILVPAGSRRTGTIDNQ